MLPIYRSDAQSPSEAYDYQQIRPGYYFEATLKDPAPQRFWRREKFRAVVELAPDQDMLLVVEVEPLVRVR